MYEIEFTDGDNNKASILMGWLAAASGSYEYPDTPQQDMGFWYALSPHTIGTTGAGTWKYMFYTDSMFLYERAQTERTQKPQGKPVVEEFNAVVLKMRWAHQFPLKVGDHGPAYHSGWGKRLAKSAGEDECWWKCVSIR